MIVTTCTLGCGDDDTSFVARDSDGGAADSEAAAEAASEDGGIIPPKLEDADRVLPDGTLVIGDKLAFANVGSVNLDEEDGAASLWGQFGTLAANADVPEDDVVVEGACVMVVDRNRVSSYTEPISLGALTVLVNGTEAIQVQPREDKAYVWQSEASLFEPGDALTLELAGEEGPGFSMDLAEAPGGLLSTLAPAPVKPGEPVEIRWEAAQEAYGNVAFEISVISTEDVLVDCEAPIESGSIVIPGVMTQRLAENLQVAPSSFGLWVHQRAIVAEQVDDSVVAWTVRRTSSEHMLTVSFSP